MCQIRKSTKIEDIESVFNITQKLAMEHSEEFLNVKCLEYSSPSWARSVLANDQAIKWAKPKVLVYADSVLCLGQMRDTQGAIDGKVNWKDSGCTRFTLIQWESMVKQLSSSGKIFPRFSSLSDLQETQKDMARKNNQPEEFKDRIIFMSINVENE